MKERPILFNSDMVNAILEGRKTQTRRVVKGVYRNVADIELVKIGEHSCASPDDEKALANCPYGKVGDQLWVRETFFIDCCEALVKIPKAPTDLQRESIYYRADGECCEQIPECMCGEYEGKTPWRPSIFMPRWASRIQLEITDIRVERLQDITASDIEREGAITKPTDIRDALGVWINLWESINGKGSWEENPWAWVVEFKVIKGEI